MPGPAAGRNNTLHFGSSLPSSGLPPGASPILRNETDNPQQALGTALVSDDGGAALNRLTRLICHAGCPQAISQSGPITRNGTLGFLCNEPTAHHNTRSAVINNYRFSGLCILGSPGSFCHGSAIVVQATSSDIYESKVTAVSSVSVRRCRVCHSNGRYHLTAPRRLDDTRQRLPTIQESSRTILEPVSHGLTQSPP